MRQVPKTSIVIIGNGRMARHFQYYLQTQGTPVPTWGRSQSETPSETKPETTKETLNTFLNRHNPNTALVLIRDSAIVSFIEENPRLEGMQLVHFSGCLSTSRAAGMHPLMTFGPTLYPPEFYDRIPFICEENGDLFHKLFPQLKNPVYSIPTEMKGFYHALCVMSGNFSVLLWQKLFREFEEKLKIPSQAALPYLEQMTRNLIAQPGLALTGPLQRKDQTTIEQNVAALKTDPYLGVYEAFLEVCK